MLKYLLPNIISSCRSSHVHVCVVVVGIGGRRQVIAAMGFDTQNLGDDMQSLAAVAFLPRIDAFVNRDTFSVIPHPLSRLRNASTELAWDQIDVFFIAAAWWKHRIESYWPFPPTLRPFVVSMHVAALTHQRGYDALEKLKSFQSIAARDVASINRLDTISGGGFFAGCMTTTFYRPHLSRQRSKYLLMDTSYLADADVFRSILLKAPPFVSEQAQWISQTEEHRTTFDRPEEYLQRVEDELELFASATLVLTSRLHVFLPCIALGTPVLFVSKPPAIENERYSGFLEAMQPIISNGDDPRLASFDWVNPSLSLAQYELRAQVRERLYAVLQQSPMLSRFGHMMDAFRFSNDDYDHPPYVFDTQ